MTAILTAVRWCIIVIWICISLMIGDFEHLFMCLLAIHISSLEECVFSSLATFILCYLGFLRLSCAYCEITDTGLIAFFIKFILALFIFDLLCLHCLYLMHFLYDWFYIYTPKIYFLFGSLFPLLLLSTYVWLSLFYDLMLFLIMANFYKYYFIFVTFISFSLIVKI